MKYMITHTLFCIFTMQEINRQRNARFITIQVYMNLYILHVLLCLFCVLSQYNSSRAADDFLLPASEHVPEEVNDYKDITHYIDTSS